MKKCIACGMPMKNPEDFAMADSEKDYCKYCARPDGTMQSYEEKLNSLTGFIVKTQGIDDEAANSAAKSMMAKLSAWKLENSIKCDQENFENTDEGNLWLGIGRSLGCMEDSCKKLKNVF